MIDFIVFAKDIYLFIGTLTTHDKKKKRQSHARAEGIAKLIFKFRIGGIAEVLLQFGVSDCRNHSSDATQEKE